MYYSNLTKFTSTSVKCKKDGFLWLFLLDFQLLLALKSLKISDIFLL